MATIASMADLLRDLSLDATLESALDDLTKLAELERYGLLQDGMVSFAALTATVAADGAGTR